MGIDTKYINQFVNVTSKAALASYYFVGKNDKIKADKAAVDSMRNELNKLNISGKVVIGEGELDEAPMLFIGEKLGTLSGPEFDIAVDPLEGTNFVAQNLPGALSVIAISEKNNLFNAIIQSALPIAQSNAQAIQTYINQERSIEAQINIKEAEFAQQTALQNANNVFQLDMAQFSADQQTALSNSKFLQTVGITEANMRQQTTIQDALLMSQANLAEADFFQKTQIQNAQAFLQMDLTNLSNEQQANVLTAQQTQQRLLSNQSATNASRQFNDYDDTKRLRKVF